MHKQYDLQLFSGATIQLKHLSTNDYLFSNRIKLTSGSKETMLGCTKNQYQEGTKFQMHLAYTDFGDMLYQPIKYGDLVYLKQLDQIVTINVNSKSQTSNQKEAILMEKQNEILGSQIFVITPSELWQGSLLKIKESTINQASIIRLINITSNLSLHSNSIYFKQKDLTGCIEVTGCSERDQNDDWFINIHDINLKDGMIHVLPRFSKPIFHGSLVIIRNAFLGTALNSHSVLLKSKNQEVTTNPVIPRIQNELWEVVLMKIEGERKRSIENQLLYGEKFSLLHSKTNQFLKYNQGQTNSDKTFQVCCSDENLFLEEWSIIPLIPQQTPAVFCNDFFLIQNNTCQQYLTSIAEPSYTTKQQYKTFLTQLPTNASVWTIEAVLNNKQNYS
ncbi:unnamed protein product (macronuclear) [Paramecium tetraurelia]|uniref:MIR domain-containing protein n=1 Tax=Paramecium tetraurelia TaxID=5888 RepID=A0DK13_PARTE|nr:uncharacterized protein GSPATT00017724001 [Paramecium tetraurelia]CAK83380.1 unnamed protein product [Paramecium tetraurelia]|eukprot:XP_001450777.1 hypothetical protein (macronuclear) [Paramecium tetraurelia strain d4-2]